jgi:AraC-like DNA-binding protein
MKSLALDGPAQTSGAAAVIHVPVRRLPALEGTIRVGVARGIVEALCDLCADPDPVIRQAGLDPRRFDDPDDVIPFSSMGRLLKHGVERTGDPYLGLRAGGRMKVSSYGIVGRLAANGSSLKDALENLAGHLHLVDEGAVMTLMLSESLAVLTYGIAQPEVECTDQIHDMAIAALTAVIRTLYRDEWAPTEVLLPRRLPADPGPYLRFFRAPVRFDEEEAALVFPAALLDQRISGADAVHRRILKERIRDREATHDHGLTGELRRLLRSRMAKGNCSVSAVADSVALHRRTLNRRLRAEGTKFRRLAAETRFEIARQLLADTSVPMVQVAIVLGYSEASAFTRAFKRWSGRTPSEWRSRHLRVALAPAEQVTERVSGDMDPAAGAG